MSFLKALKSKRVIGVVSVAGAALGAGYVMNRYREKAAVAGVPGDLIAGVGLTVLSLASGSLGGTLGKYARKVAPVAGIVGAGALAGFLHTKGASWGASQSGVKRILVKDADVAKVQKLAPSSVVLGAIPKAAHGDMLSSSQLAALARA